MSPEDLYEEFWNWRIRRYPEFATASGFHSYDDELEDMSIEGYNARFSEAKDYLVKVVRLRKNEALSQTHQLNLKLLENDIKECLNGSVFKSYLFPINQLEGPQTDFPLLIFMMKKNTAKDYEMILDRFRRFPAQVNQIIELLKCGIKEKYVMCCISVRPVPAQISGLVSKPIEESPFFEPFRKPAHGINEKRWAEIVDEGKGLIKDCILPSLEKLSEYLKVYYIPNARTTIAINTMRNGKEYYQKCLEFHTTTTLSPEEIHEIGKAEVQRIKQCMEQVKEDINFIGDLSQLFEYLRTDEKFAFKTKEEIIDSYLKVCNNIQEKLPGIFKTFPSAKFQILAVPDEIAPNSPGAYYIAPTGDGSRPGIFYINTDQPETRKRYDLVSLALHEAIPGHHHQLAISVEEKSLPLFRRYLEDRCYFEVPGRFACYTAYIEGWALYSEFLGEELGLYTDPYDLFGRLSNEMLRAVRLVIDTGIHAFGWSRDESITYMLNNTATVYNDAVAEVERYITSPGQACAYKIGELKFKGLRNEAQKTLGGQFDIKEFHDIVLLSGALPLGELEEKVREYISKKSNNIKLDILSS